MKKVFLAIMAFAAIALVGCKDEKNAAEEPQTTPQQQQQGDEVVPEGYVKILIQVPDGEECHGIYMKGNLNGSDWSGENTYIGLENGQAEAEKAIKFERIADKSDFFSALFKLGENGLEGAVCQKYPNDGSWQGKSRKVKLIEDKTTLEGAKDLSLPQFHIPAGTKPGVLALKIGGWENSECVVANGPGKATWTMKTSVALPEGTQVGITGTNLEGYANWDHSNPIIMQKQADGSYIAINNVKENCVYKYVLKLPGEPVFADHHGHVIDGDAENLVMPVSLEPVDNVDAWLELDKIYGGEEFKQEDHMFSLIGDAIGGWDKDIEFAYAAKDGDFFVCEAANVAMTAAEFKIRENKSWDAPNANFGWGGFEILGDPENFEDPGNGNVKCKADATYKKVTFKFKWNGVATAERSLTFTK